MSTAEAPARQPGVNGTAILTLLAVVQLVWIGALVYGVVWLLT